MIQYTGVAAATALVAGCNGNGNGNGNDNGNGNGNDNGNGDDVAEWEGVDEIELEGHTSGWVGVSPDPIADEENPTLILFEGQEYDITWENADGDEHNLELRDDGGEVVDDYETDFNSSEGESETLEGVEPTDEMTNYVCEPHESTMDGEIQIEQNGGNGDEGNGDEENGDEENDQ
ncbi:cupredoxin domain-containing protein [Halostagnicola bangensis]